MNNIYFRDKYYGNTYRGANLTSLGKTIQSVADQVRNNDFFDLYIGDYFPITMYGKTINWHIADINYFLNTGDTQFDKPHLVMVNDVFILYKYMNSTNTTDGGYVNSDMRKTTLPEILDVLNRTDFKSHILTHRELLSWSVDPDARSGGCPNWYGCTDKWGWYDSTIELLTEPQVYGTTSFSSSGYDVGLGHKQFSIFKLNKEFINNQRNWWWLRSVAAITSFCYVGGGGDTYANGAAYAGGIRCYFCFG